MDLFSELLRQPDIKEYLSAYPQTQWLHVIQATMLYGISSLRALKTAGLSVDVLDDPAKPASKAFVPSIKGKLNDMRTQIEEIDRFLEEVPKYSAEESVKPECEIKGARSSSVPGRTKAEKRVQPTQTKGGGAEDYSPLIYPEWWPKDSAGSRPPPVHPPPKRVSKAKPAKAKVVTTFVDSPKEPKPIMKTTGTSTTLVQPPFRMNYTPRPTTKPTKTVGFTQPKPPPCEPPVEDRPRSDLLPLSDEDSSLLPQQPSISSSNKGDPPRLKWSLPDGEQVSEEALEERKTPGQREDARTVKRQQFANWVGDFSNVVKRSPLQSSAEYTSQSSEQRMKESSGGSRRDPNAIADPARHFETSSASSISTYHPSEELKAFYRNEHEKIFAEPPRKTALKTLEAREMALEPNHVSMSAQLYRTSGSSDISEGERYHDEAIDSFSRS